MTDQLNTDNPMLVIDCFLVFLHINYKIHLRCVISGVYKSYGSTWALYDNTFFHANLRLQHI